MAPLRDYLSRLWRDLTLNRIAASILVPDGQRWRLLRLFGMSVEPCTVFAGSMLGRNMRIGRGCVMNYQVFVDDTGGVTLGDNVYVGMQTMFLSASHEPGAPQRRAGAIVKRPIEVGDGVWIGGRVVLLPGTKIGAGAVLSAGSVVRGTVPANTLWAGNPAVQIREL